MKVIATKAAPQAIGAYSQAIMAEGKFLFVSGQLPMKSGSAQIVISDIGEQTTLAMQNMGAILKEAGLTYDNLVKTTIYTTDISSFAEINEAYAAFFKGSQFPARAVIEVSALPKGSKVEIEAVAQCC